MRGTFRAAIRGTPPTGKWRRNHGSADCRYLHADVGIAAETGASIYQAALDAVLQSHIPLPFENGRPHLGNDNPLINSVPGKYWTAGLEKVATWRVRSWTTMEPLYK